MLSNQMISTLKKGLLFSTVPLGTKHYALHEYYHYVLSDCPLKIMKLSLN